MLELILAPIPTRLPIVIGELRDIGVAELLVVPDGLPSAAYHRGQANSLHK